MPHDVGKRRGVDSKTDGGAARRDLPQSALEGHRRAGCGAPAPHRPSRDLANEIVERGHRISGGCLEDAVELPGRFSGNAAAAAMEAVAPLARCPVDPGRPEGPEPRLERFPARRHADRQRVVRAEEDRWWRGFDSDRDIGFALARRLSRLARLEGIGWRWRDRGLPGGEAGWGASPRPRADASGLIIGSQRRSRIAERVAVGTLCENIASRGTTIRHAISKAERSFMTGSASERRRFPKRAHRGRGRSSGPPTGCRGGKVVWPPDRDNPEWGGVPFGRTRCQGLAVGKKAKGLSPTPATDGARGRGDRPPRSRA